MFAHSRYLSRSDGGLARPKKADVWVNAMSRVTDDEIRSRSSIAGNGQVKVESVAVAATVNGTKH